MSLTTTVSPYSKKKESQPEPDNKRMKTPASVVLSGKNPEPVVSAAKKLGYLPVSKEGDKQIILRNKQNSSELRISSASDGKLNLSSTRGFRSLWAVMRQVTLDSIEHLLEKRGMSIESTRVVDSAIEIVATENGFNHSKPATVKSSVATDGVLSVDVDHTLGKRCEEITTDFANAISGWVVEERKKVEYYSSGAVQKNAQTA